MVEYLAVIQQCPEGTGIQCPGCGICLPERFFHLDHRMPKSEGGVNDISNRMLLCSPCNGSKAGTKTLQGLHHDNLKAGHCQPGWDRKALRRMTQHINDSVERLKWELR